VDEPTVGLIRSRGVNSGPSFIGW
jgi:hypothetical protein